MKYFMLAAMACLSCSCATVIRGTSETAQFESTPTGAEVTAESTSEDKMGPFNCTTPCELELKRKRTWKVDFELEGYKPASALLKPVVTGGGVASGAGNIIAGGLIGMGIDAGTGANLDLRPNPMIAELVPLDSPEDSRVLDADPVVEEIIEEEGAAGEEIEADAGVTVEEAPAELDNTEAEAPETELPAEDIGAESADVMSANETPKNVNVGAEQAEAPIVNVSSPAAEGPDHAQVRLYKPGEVAPNDEEADDLNKLQLKAIEN